MKKSIKVSLSGKELLRTPLLNKGTAFSERERNEFGLIGLLPNHISSIEEQVRRRYHNFKEKQTRIEKYQLLVDLQNRNETLFYRLVLDYIEEMLPYVYTPTVGDASISFSMHYNQSRGLFIPYEEECDIETMLQNTKQKDVEVIVVTDGERILGLGDLGVGGMAIPIGKLNLYTLFGGVNPNKTLPICLDVGTNNPKLLKDPLYIGRQELRITGEKYYQFIDRFVQAVKKVYPNALLQWEDFARIHAEPLLKKYEEEIVSFNDDIQGTAASVLAGLLAAIKMKKGSIMEERIAILGGGSAGMGIANIIVEYLVSLGVSKQEARKQIYIIDKHGLIHDGLDHIEPHHVPYSRSKSEIQFWKSSSDEIALNSVVKEAKITALFGVSTQKGAFNRSIVKAMLKNTNRPIIFPLSNPNSKSEADPKDLTNWSKGNVICATGSPFPSYDYKGEKIHPAQCNNVYIFPAFGLATSTVKFKKITMSMFLTAAEALSERAQPYLFPPFANLRKVSKYIALKVIQKGIEEGNIEAPNEDITTLLERSMWYPNYAIFERELQPASQA